MTTGGGGTEAGRGRDVSKYPVRGLSQTPHLEHSTGRDQVRGGEDGETELQIDGIFSFVLRGEGNLYYKSCDKRGQSAMVKEGQGRRDLCLHTLDAFLQRHPAAKTRTY